MADSHFCSSEGLGLVVLSAVAGLLVTAAITPVIALSGLGATNAITVFESLPGYLDIEPLSQKSNIYATTPAREIKEMRLAIAAEKKFPQNDILRQYLNITGFGGTVYGIEAAANYYFGTTAAELTLPQAASLVAIVNNPAKFRLDNPGSETNGYAGNKARRDYILREMVEHEKITAAEFQAAVATPVQPAIQEPSTGCRTAGGSAYFCDYVTHLLRNDPAFGEDDGKRLQNSRRGGYAVYTTLDLDLQLAAEATLAANVPMEYPGKDVGSVITSVQATSAAYNGVN